MRGTSSGIADPPSFAWTAGRRYSFGATTITAAAPSQDELRSAPIYVPNAVTLDEIRVEVTIAGGLGSVSRFCWFECLRDGLPGALIADYGVVASDAIGQKAIAIGQFLTPGWYQAAVVPQIAAAPTYRCCSGFPADVFPQPAGPTFMHAGYSKYGVAGAAPASFGAAAQDTGDMPRIEVRVSA